MAPGGKKPLSSRLTALSNESLQTRHDAQTLVEEQFHNFDIVWAKVQGFPWWPGVFFHSWDAVLHAGIRTESRIRSELLVPGTENEATSETSLFTGHKTGICAPKRYCLIMFLDKFNFSVLEIKATNVASFTSHYHFYERAVMRNRSSKWGKKKAEFKRAVVKAVQLLHMGNEYVKEDLMMLEEQLSRATEKEYVKNGVESETDEQEVGNEDAWDDGDNGSQTGVDVEEESTDEQKTLRKGTQKEVMVRKEKLMEVKEMDDDVVTLTPGTSKRQEEVKKLEVRAQKRLQREECIASHAVSVSRLPLSIDLAETPMKKLRAAYNDKTSDKECEHVMKCRNNEASGKQNEMDVKSLTKGNARVSTMEDGMLKQSAEQKDQQVLDADTGIIEEEPNNLVLSPLSSIWTTGVSSGPSAVAGQHRQLAYKQDFVWDGSIFTDELSIAEKQKAAKKRKQAEDTASGRERLSGKRLLRSVQKLQILQNLMAGGLNPHTMVQCAVYRPKDDVDGPNSRSRGGPTLDPPFQVVVHPDAVFVVDLHAHLATCEIIGFLGGKWDEASKTLYIQAAFPCRSLVIDGDDGSTDVEMDPGSEIELRGIIENAQLEVVGWYHSHPAFAPDPSVRDIENQTSYQQLFQRPNTKNEKSADNKLSEPFVGLIVGTYDTRRNTPVSLLRFFHTRVEKVGGSACRAIYMPYEFIPGRRHFRKVLEDEEREKTRMFSMYHSVLQHFNFELGVMHHQLPMDIKATSAQKAMSRLLPTRVKVCGSTRRRKHSSDGAADKPVKKPRAKRKRFVRSSAAAESHNDVTRGSDKQRCEGTENDTLTIDETLEAGHNGSTDVVIEREQITASSTCEEKKMSNAVAFSSSVEENTKSSTTSLEESKSKICSVDSQIAEVLAGIIEATKAINSSADGRSVSRKPKQVNETLRSSDGTERGHLLAEHSVAVSPHASTVSQDMIEHVVRHSNDASQDVKAKFDMDTTAEPTDTRIPGSSSAILPLAVKPGVLSSTDISVFSRKRTRKPKTTTRNSNRSTSPNRDKVLSVVVPNQTNLSDQAFYDAFRPSGLRSANGGTREEITSHFGRANGSKGDNLVAKHVQYIVVDEAMGMTLPRHGSCSSATAEDTTFVQATKTTDDHHIKHEIRCFITSLVERVAEKAELEICAGTQVSAQDRTAKMSVSSDSKMTSVSSHSFPMKLPVNDVKMESTDMKSTEFTVNNDVRTSTVCHGLQLFGSNGECEDIQTSLQKMVGYMDKLKSTQTIIPSVTMTKSQKDATRGKDANIVVASAEPKHGKIKAEQVHLTALRTKYGAGVSGCAEQAITLVDYYRDFERRTDLNEIWKARITKLEKIESSLLEYVQYLNIPVALRRDFIKDLILYLRESWAINNQQG